MNHERHAGNHPRGRSGLAAVPADRDAIQTRGADWRQVPADRHSDQQLPARGHPSHLRADAVQFRVAQPPHLEHLSPRPLLRRLRRDPRRRADARQSQLVSRHGGRRPAGSPTLRAARREVQPDPRRRPSLPDELRRAGRGASSAEGRHHHRRPAGRPRDRDADGYLPLRSRRRHRRLRGEAERVAAARDRPQHPVRRRLRRAQSTSGRSWPRWASMSSRAAC